MLNQTFRFPAIFLSKITGCQAPVLQWYYIKLLYSWLMGSFDEHPRKDVALLHQMKQQSAL